MVQPHPAVPQILADFVARRQLPAGFAADAVAHLWPLAAWIGQQHAQAGRCLVVGINGAQG